MSQANLFDILKPHDIVLIDNDEWIRGAVSMFFENEGVSITALETAEEGLKEVKKNRYSIIIADYRLPGIDGLTFFKKIKTDQPHALKIMISAYGNEGLIRESRKFGVHAFIEKPFTTDMIESTMMDLIQKGFLPET